MTLSADERALIQDAIDTLRRLAIVEVHKPGVQAVVVTGYRCKVCGWTWSVHAREVHNQTCILDGSKTIC